MICIWLIFLHKIKDLFWVFRHFTVSHIFNVTSPWINFNGAQRYDFFGWKLQRKKSEIWTWGEIPSWELACHSQRHYWVNDFPNFPRWDMFFHKNHLAIHQPCLHCLQWFEVSLFHVNLRANANCPPGEIAGLIQRLLRDTHASYFGITSLRFQLIHGGLWAHMIDTSPRKFNSSPLKNGWERKIKPFLLKNGGLFSGATQENFQKVIHLNVGCDQKEGAFFVFLDGPCEMPLIQVGSSHTLWYS